MPVEGPAPRQECRYPAAQEAPRPALKHLGGVVHDPSNHVTHITVARQLRRPGKEPRNPADFPDRQPRPLRPRKPEMCAEPFCAHFEVYRVLQNDHKTAESRGSTPTAWLVNVRSTSSDPRQRTSRRAAGPPLTASQHTGLRHGTQDRTQASQDRRALQSTRARDRHTQSCVAMFGPSTPPAPEHTASS